MADHPVLNQVNIVVTDMNATVAFYRRLGLSIAETAPEWATRHRTASMPNGIDLARFAAGPQTGHNPPVIGTVASAKMVGPLGKVTITLEAGDAPLVPGKVARVWEAP